MVAAIPLLPLNRARQSRGTDQGKGNPTAKTNLAVSAHGTSDLISYLKYSLLNHSNIIVWPLSQNIVSFCIPVDHAHKKAKEKRQRSKRQDCKRQVCGKLNSSCKEQSCFAGRDRNSPQVTGSLLSPVWEVTYCTYCRDTQSTERCTGAHKKIGPKKEEKTPFAIGRPENEERVRVPPLAGRLSRQKEITEPFVLTVAKPLPQKKERKKMLCTAR